jgi:hypothetical protein
MGGTCVINEKVLRVAVSCLMSAVRGKELWIKIEVGIARIQGKGVSNWRRRMVFFSVPGRRALFHGMALLASGTPAGDQPARTLA